MKPFNEHNPQTGLQSEVGDNFMHGDVVVFNEGMLPVDFDLMPEITDACLAYGEATGHMHKLFGGKFELREHPQTKTRWLKVVTPVMLKHQEHTPIEINPGLYRIGIQREYDPFEKIARQVQD